MDLPFFTLVMLPAESCFLGLQDIKWSSFSRPLKLKTRVEQLVELAVNKLRGIKDGRNESKMRGWTGVD
jgi:hypothetical protein